jgi:hypothetical protein
MCNSDILPGFHRVEGGIYPQHEFDNVILVGRLIFDVTTPPNKEKKKKKQILYK